MRYDSSGAFTLAPERIQCVLPDPYLALVKVVQAAVAGGATGVAIDADPLGVTVTYDGPPADLRDLQHALLESGARQHLAVAVQAPLGQVARQVEIQTAAERGVWTSGGHWLKPARGKHNRYRLTRDLRAVSRVVNRLFACPEASLLQERCRYAPIPVLLNGRRLNPVTLGARGEHLEETYVLAEEGDAEPLLAPAVSYAERPPRLPARYLTGKPVPCRAVLIQRREGGPGRALFLKHGVVAATEPLERDGLLALLSCQGLSLDLTGFALVRDQALKATLKGLA